MAAEFDYGVHEALRTFTEFKMAADFENMGYEAVAKSFCRIKISAMKPY